VGRAWRGADRILGCFDFCFFIIPVFYFSGFFLLVFLFYSLSCYRAFLASGLFRGARTSEIFPDCAGLSGAQPRQVRGLV